MKVYKQSIILGILSILSGLLFVGVPLGSKMIEIVNIAVIAIGAVAIVLLGVLKKKYTLATIISAIYMAAVAVMTVVIESTMTGFTMLYIGFVPGLVIAVTSLITSIQLKGEKKILAGMIFTAIGLLINIFSAIMSVVTLIS